VLGARSITYIYSRAYTLRLATYVQKNSCTTSAGKSFRTIYIIYSNRQTYIFCLTVTSKVNYCHKMKYCAGCKFARYCCRQCQVEDWANHKPDCMAIRRSEYNHRHRRRVGCYYGCMSDQMHIHYHVTLRRMQEVRRELEAVGASINFN